ncbi:MAG TPA: hypothetical protein VKE22_27805 [Haliangiales bacterium]|nr:hypothetical protein [Haliangiales bacterium]
MRPMSVTDPRHPTADDDDTRPLRVQGAEPTPVPDDAPGEATAPYVLRPKGAEKPRTGEEGPEEPDKG